MAIRRTLLKSATALIALTVTSPAIAHSNEPIPVVATFSILGEMVEHIKGDHIEVTTLVGPNGDAHVYQPNPNAARAVSGADILVLNGLNFEGWIDRLIEASGFDGTRVVAADGIDPIAFDPHAWKVLDNAVTYVDNITAALAQANPDNASTFYANRDSHVTEIEAFDAEIRDIVATLPENRRTVVTSHEAFQYFVRDYSQTVVAPQALSTESEASARDVSQLIETMRAEKVGAVFFKNIADSRLLEQIVDETEATIGGTLYPGVLSEPADPAPTYLDMMRRNATTLADALNS